MRTAARETERSKVEALGTWATFGSCLLAAKAAGKSHVSAQHGTDPATGLCIKDSSLLDPACGSGNFLTETYLSLRKLENRVLEDLCGGQMVMGELEPIQVTLDQFYGIEVNDFAVEVAKAALWIAELQVLDQTREILSMWIDPLPLKRNDHIVCANALRTDWGVALLLHRDHSLVDFRRVTYLG